MKTIVFNNKNKEEIISETVKILDREGLVIFPSDTVYGVLVDATKENAVKKLTLFKNRPIGKPISVFVADFKMLQKYVSVNRKNTKLLNELLPGPFTVILNSLKKVNSRLESERQTLGVRIPEYKLITELVSRFGKPVSATSANLSGRNPHYSIESLMGELGKEKKSLIDLVIDAGKLPRNKPSTIIDLTNAESKILRKGEVVFAKTNTYMSPSANTTYKTGEFLMGKYLNLSNRKPLVFVLEGELGAGKTVFIKGIGSRLGIKDIVSPTFVIYYEYGNFYHFDLYQIEESQEFEHLKIERLLKPGNVLCFEWGEKIGPLYELLRSKANIITVKIEYVNEQTRKIKISR